MLTLILLRHAKAVASDPDGDHARSLSSRGRQEIGFVGARLRELGLAPDLTLVSDARRTRETAELLLAAYPVTSEVCFKPELYGASTDAILAVLRQSAAQASTVLIVGHNPGIGEIARHLAGEGEPNALAVLQERFPTSTAAVLVFHGAAWPDVQPGTGRLSHLLGP